jgi:hypothetical protein
MENDSLHFYLSKNILTLPSILKDISLSTEHWIGIPKQGRYKKLNKTQTNKQKPYN